MILALWSKAKIRELYSRLKMYSKVTIQVEELK